VYLGRRSARIQNNESVWVSRCQFDVCARDAPMEIGFFALDPVALTFDPFETCLRV
jgi:hypothetical protein